MNNVGNEQQQQLSPTTRMNLMSATSTEPFAAINQSTDTAPHFSVFIPPLQNLSTDDGNEELQTSTSNIATLMYIEDEITGNLSPPKLKRI